MAEVEAFEVGGISYKAGPIPAFDQVVISKRVLPAIRGSMTPAVVLALMSAKDESGKVDLKRLDIMVVLPAMADAVYNLSDDDAMRVIKTTLKAVRRQNPGGMWTAVLTPQGDLMFQDLNMVQMLQIVWRVLEANLSEFFPTPR